MKIFKLQYTNRYKHKLKPNLLQVSSQYMFKDQRKIVLIISLY